MKIQLMELGLNQTITATLDHKRIKSKIKETSQFYAEYHASQSFDTKWFLKAFTYLKSTYSEMTNKNTDRPTQSSTTCINPVM